MHDNDYSLNSSQCEEVDVQQQATDQQLPRRFRFGEFFAGMGGLSTAMMFVLESWISLGSIERMDAYEDSWNILNDGDFAKSKELCQTGLDHGHFAPPCRTLTEARRTDEHGAVAIMRSPMWPEGWGHPDAIEANEIVTRMVVLCLLLHNSGKTFAIENPFNSFLWLLKDMQKLMKLRTAELVLLHQCCYGAQTMKPTGLLTTAPWMKMVRSLCHEVRAHRHLTEGLVGKVWSYLDERVVWRSSLAAEYPCGLCMAWAEALKKWLFSDEGIHWMRRNSLILVGKWGNQLVRADLVEKQANEHKPVASLASVRSEENNKCIGGLRSARASVMKSRSLRKLGKRVRKLFESKRDDRVLAMWEENVQNGLPEEWINENRYALAQEFGVQINVGGGFQSSLWKALLVEAEDCEAQYLPAWMAEGFPLGIHKPITPSGAFPLVEGDTSAVEASRAEGRVMHDLDGSHSNYISFEEAGMKGQDILDDMVRKGRAVCYYSWDDVVKTLGPEARLTKLGCIVKLRPDHTEKVRIIVDSRRSGVNGLTSIHERVVLPRVTDITSTWYRLTRSHEGSKVIEMMTADFKDAFNMLQLADAEKPMVIVKGMDGEQGQPRYYAFQVVVFGLAPGPLLWGRVAAAAMRLAQALMLPDEAEVATFVDDPLILAAGATKRERTWSFAKFVVLWLVLGLELSWPKAHRGFEVDWIGFSLSISNKQGAWAIQVQLMEAKKEKLKAVVDDLISHKGVLPLAKLQLAVGILGWITSSMPMARPFVAMIWAAILQHDRPKASTTRVRKGLVFVKQVRHALQWLQSLLCEFDARHGGLKRTVRWRPFAPVVVIQTDACPTGLGGFIMVHNKIVAYWFDKVTNEDQEVLGVVYGDPSFQSELELLAVLVSLRVFKRWLSTDSGPAGILLKTDNTATLQAAMELRGKSVLMAQLASEVALEIEAIQVPYLWGQHVAGILNDIADKLSRMHEHSAVPAELSDAECVTGPLRTVDFYKSWQLTR